MMWSMLRFVLATIAGLAMPVTAFAHAALVRTAPPAGGTVSVAPTEVVALFSETVEPSLSSIVVQDSSGVRMDDGVAHIAGGDAHRLAVGLKPLQPGTYTVQWKVTSTDTHKTQGKFIFKVKP